MPGGDWPGLTRIPGAGPHPSLSGRALLPQSFHLSGPRLPYLCLGHSLDWPTGRKFTVVQGSGFHCWSAHSKVKRLFYNSCPGLTPSPVLWLALVVPSGKTQISLPLRTLENSCHALSKSCLLEACRRCPQVFLIAEYTPKHTIQLLVGRRHSINVSELNKQIDE